MLNAHFIHVYMSKECDHTQYDQKHYLRNNRQTTLITTNYAGKSNETPQCPYLSQYLTDFFPLTSYIKYF